MPLLPTMKFLCVLLSSVMALSATLTGCIQSGLKASSAPLGKTKSSVVETFGSPERSWRKDGRDYWYYNPSSKEPSEKVILVFENGNLVEKIQPGHSPQFNELETELRKLQPQEKGEFKTLSE